MERSLHIRGRALVLTLTAVAFFASAGPALSARADMWLDTAGGAHVKYVADPGETNNVTVDGCGTGCIDITDSGAKIFAGWGWFQTYGCKSISSNEARCTHPIDIVGFESTLGDQNDRLVLGGALSPSLVTMVGGGPGDDTLVGGPGNDNLYGNDGNDMIFGGANCDVVSGQNGDDVLDGGGAADILSGGPGIDTADYSSRTARVFVSLDLTINGGYCTGAPLGNDGQAGEGDNVNEDVENVTGGQGNDSLYGSAADNVLDGGPGNDLLDGGGGADTLIGGAGVDTADYSGRTADVAVTLDGVANDGQAGEGDNVQTENVSGGAGNDTLVGDANANVLDGGPGNDVLDGGLGPDTLIGGSGFDKVDYSGRTTDVHVSLDNYPNDGNWTVPNPLDPYTVVTEGDNVQQDVERVDTGSGNDVLVGSSANNEFHAGDGNDVLTGGGGQDALFGDAGDDQLHVDDGDVNDTVSCGSGTDSVGADQRYYEYRPIWYIPPADAVASDCETVTWNWVVPLPVLKTYP